MQHGGTLTKNSIKTVLLERKLEVYGFMNERDTLRMVGSNQAAGV